MSTKFFTWTKGDRRVAQDALRIGGVDSIPSEYTPVKVKGDGECPPLVLDSASLPSSKHRSRTKDAIALQDAALQSATNLIAVMNDVLRSPQMSAHLRAQSSPTVAPRRQRSKTISHNPHLENVRQHAVAELPGSFPRSRAYSIDDKSLRLHLADRNALQGAYIEPLHSTTQKVTQFSLSSTRTRSENVAENANEMPTAIQSPGLKYTSPGNISSQQLQTRSATESSTTMASTSKCSPLERSPLSATSGTMRSIYGPHLTGSPSNQQVALSDASATPWMRRDQDTSEAALVHQIALVRTSHEAHVARLKEAHNREVESQRIYISLLESKCCLPMAPETGVLQHHWNTSDAAHSIELPCPDASTNLIRPLEFLESRKSAPDEAIAEVEALKRKLSVLRKIQIDNTKVRRERNELREYIDRSDRWIVQLESMISTAKESEKALETANCDLETRLETANIQRVDLLEGLEVAWSDVRKLSEKEKLLVNEINDLRQCLSGNLPRYASDPILAKPVTLELTLGSNKEVVTPSREANLDALLREIEDLKSEMHKKDLRIQELRIAATPPRSMSDKRRQSELETSLGDLKEQLTMVKADCDRSNSLLHDEIRHQSRIAAGKSRVVALEPEAQSSGVAAQKVKSTISADKGLKHENFEEAINLLEQELEYCTKEIIKYKLDVKGYKKDLKKARAEIEGLQALTRGQRPPTPVQENQKSVRRGFHDGRWDGSSSESGLEILIPVRDPSTPTKTRTSAKGPFGITAWQSTHQAPVSNVQHAGSSSIPRTPPSSTSSSKDKALPRLPSAVNTSTILQRGLTTRSISDSIISSYADRSTPEPYHPPPPPKRFSHDAPRKFHRTSARPIYMDREDDAGESAQTFLGRTPPAPHDSPVPPLTSREVWGSENMVAAV